MEAVIGNHINLPKALAFIFTFLRNAARCPRSSPSFRPSVCLSGLATN